MHSSRFLPLVLALASACSTTLPDPAIPDASEELDRVPGSDPRGAGYSVAIRATACWVGDRWGEALGERGETLRKNGADRCHDVFADLGLPPPSSPADALSPGNVDAIAAAVALAARGDEHEAPYVRELVAFVRTVAATVRETDEGASAAAPEGSSLAMLFHMRGPYRADARVVGTIETIARAKKRGESVGEASVLAARVEATCNDLDTPTPLDPYCRGVAARLSGEPAR